MTAIDLNADLGEGSAYDLVLLGVVSSCNIACGGHTGDKQSMIETARAAIKHDVAVGAHPSYPDRDGFGRRSRYLAGSALFTSLREQIEALRKIAESEGTVLTHVKPHGALYYDAAGDSALAELVVDAINRTLDTASLIGPPGSELQQVANHCGVSFVREAFVDRAYESDGTLVPRTKPGAVHNNINTITTQAVGLATSGRVTAQDGEVIEVAADTLCIHGDTPNAGEAAQAVYDVLRANGVDIRAAG